MRSTLVRFALAGLFTAVCATTLGVSGTASATGACQATNHGDLDGITTVPAATVQLTGDGVKISTPDIPAKVGWKKTFAPMDADGFISAAYTLTKLDDGSVNAAALPAFHIYVKIGSDFATLVYEPYYQIVGNPVRNIETPWLINAASKFWTSSNKVAGLAPEGGGSYAGNKTWAQINLANPTMEIVGYGWGQGTYNAGTVALLNDVKFVAAKYCASDKWSTRYTKASPSASPSVSVSVSVGATPSTTPVGNTGLPVTGAPVPLIVGAGVVLVAMGAASLFLLRRRPGKSAV